MDSLNDLIWTDENLPEDEGDVEPYVTLNNPYVCLDAMSCGEADWTCSKPTLSGYCPPAA